MVKRTGRGFAVSLALIAPSGASLVAADADCHHPLFPVEAGAVWTYRSTAISRHTGDVGPPPPPFEYKAGILGVSSGRFVLIEALPLAGRPETLGWTRRRAWACRPAGLLELATEVDDGVGTTGVTLPRDVAPGREWTVQRTPPSPRPEGMMSGAWACRYKAIERAAVGTPAGQKTALVIDGDCTSGPRFRVQTRDWWVDGVGLVKREVTNKTTIGVTSDRIELIAFNVLALAAATVQLDVDSPAARRRHLSTKAKDADPEVRGWAVAALGTPWDPEALSVLTAALGDASEIVQGAAEGALGKSKDRQVIPILIAALRDPRPATRRSAAHALELLEDDGIHDPKTVAALTTLLTDGDASVRFAGAQALGSTASPLALEALASLLRDKDPKMRATAVARIIQLAASGVDAGRVRDALQALAGGDPDAEVRESARMAVAYVEQQRRR